LASNEKAGRPLWSLGFFIILSAGNARAMNHNVLHRTPLDVAGSRSAGLERLPFKEGLFRTKAATASLESRELESPAGFDDLVGSLTAEVPAGGEARIQFDDGKAAGHFRANPNSIYITSQAGKVVDVMLKLDGFAPVTAQVMKDKGGAEAAD